MDEVHRQTIAQIQHDFSEPKHAVPAEVIVGIAKLIGIDPVAEPQYLWIAEEASRAQLPIDWKELINQDGETMYYHVATRKLQKVHPLVERYSQIYHKQRSFTKMMVQGERDDLDSVETKLSVLTTEIKSRASKNLPDPTTPEIIEKMCLLLDIETSKEYFLVRCVKQTLAAYVEKRFHLGSFVTDLTDEIKFLRRVRKQQVKVDVIKTPDHIIMCQECEAKSAVVKCEQCKDYFCQDCFNATHSTGKRRAHLTSDVEQLVCAAYDDRPATCQCVQCGLFYSDQGFHEIHAYRWELGKHVKRVIDGLVCLECEHFNASVLCEDCVDLFCTECFIKLHRKGKRRQHVHLTIDNTGQIFRGGFLVPPLEAEVLKDRARSTVESGPWLQFRDDNQQMYWYHLVDKKTTHHSPHDDAPALGD
jgi:hypothetical protein